MWQRETLVADSDRKNFSSAQSLPQDIPGARFPELPQLSGSVDSLVDEEAVDFTSVSAPLEIRPRILRQDSTLSRRTHISSDDFEKMIVSIVKDKGPLSAPPQIPSMQTLQKESIPAPPAFERSGSTTTESQSPTKSTASDASDASLALPSPQTPSRTTVVRGFSPSQIPVPRTIPSASYGIATDAIPEPKSSPAPKPVQSKKQAVFALGASCSSSEQDQSLDNRKPIIPIVKKPMFQIGGSSEEEGSLKSALASPRPGSLLSPQKKQASFANHVTTINDETAIDSDTDIDESAIDDDEDSSDWEDSVEDSGKSSMDDKFFQRVDSKANLTSRRSLITLMLAHNERQAERARALGNHASQSTSALPRSRMAPNGPSLGASPNDSDEAPLMMKGMRPTLKPIHEIPRSNAQPIVGHAQHVQGQAALSPRTTRRNMLATELTESLRRHLLWERQQKSSTANAVLKRRHTSHDVANLRQYPEKSCIKPSEDVNASSWNQYFSKEASNGYHSKGW